MIYDNVLPITMIEFEPYLGKVFNLQNTELPVELKLVEIEDTTQGRPWPYRLPKPFVMIFAGPPERIVLEGLRVLKAPDGTDYQLHLIPIMTHDPLTTGQQYQVVIN